MLSRCNKETDMFYSVYGGIGISYDPSWDDYANFSRDARYIFQFDKFYNNPILYQIDKDYKQLHLPKSQRIYSKDTCSFLYYIDNNNLRAIEARQDHPENFSSRFFGVSKVEKVIKDSWYAKFILNGNNMNIGIFNNEIAAASAYNYWYRYYHQYELVPLLNTLEYEMPPDEFIKYNTAVRQLYRLY